MKLFKKLFTATIIILIILSVAGIIYVLQFQEEKPEIKRPEKITKKTVARKIKKFKSLPSKPISLREVAIIIDDIGYDLNAAKALMKIDANLTFSVLPFQKYSREAAKMLHKAKKEILLHLPMEPVSYPQEKPGEGALFTDMNNEELLFQLKNDIYAVPYIVGVSNHMGSKFMNDEQKLSLVFKELKKRNMFFVDSRTSPDTKALSIAKKTGLNIAERKIFIDNNRNYNEIYDNLINVTKSNDDSPVIIIGHPYPETVRALKDAVEVMRAKGISIVPASRIIKEARNSQKKS
ncbi:MAG: divergent polysaccharide deacetylase family protein [Syntrophaceae bacterium]|nr:divergent polysaccharide deacetylase family protein [Syntrophaceae bacterium]